MLLNTVDHYQNLHVNCDKDSECSNPNYLPSRDLITNDRAATKAKQTLKMSKVYKHAPGKTLKIKKYVIVFAQ